MCYTRSEVFHYLAAHGGVLQSSRNTIVTYFVERFGTSFSPEDDVTCNHISNVLSQLQKRWRKASRTTKIFLDDNGGWLQEKICLPGKICRPPSAYARRRVLPFVDKGRRAKLLATEDLRSHSREELVFSAASSVRQEGRRSAARLVEAAGSPRRGQQLVAQRAAALAPPVPYTAEKALALLVDMDLSKGKYNMMRYSAKNQQCSIYPEYRHVAKAKASCLPTASSITVREDSARVQVQGLLDHTASRLLELQKEVVQHLVLRSSHVTRPDELTSTPNASPTSASSLNSSTVSLTLLSKWGMDGSTGHSIYKQGGSFADDKMFAVTLVPLRLVTAAGDVVWSNAAPSSPRFCRPIELRYAKETAVLTKATISAVEAEIAQLAPMKLSNCTVAYKMAMTMVDGKVVNTATGTASPQRCSMCGATPTIMNDLAAVRARPVQNTQYGISPLHAFIRCFEALLHVGYRLDPESEEDPRGQQAKRKKTTEEKSEQKKKKTTKDAEKMTARKEQVKAAFREKLGLRVDEPRVGGAGNSNDGNTARRAFGASSEFAACTGVDLQLIRDVHVMLQAITCCYQLDTAALGTFGMRTAERFVRLYPQHRMPVTLHKVLMHSAVVAESCILPLGMMSEEASEATNKQVRIYASDILTTFLVSVNVDTKLIILMFC